MTGELILVVDDEVLIAMLASEVLTDAGYRVALAHDGRMAMEMLRREAPAAVVTDYMMPRMDGLGLALAMRGEAALRNVPVVLTSALAGDVLERHPGLFFSFLQKPYDLARLLAAVRDAVAAGPAAPG